MTRPANEPRDHLFTLYLTASEHEDLTARAGYRGIPKAEYVRRALAACASVGGPEELPGRGVAKRPRLDETVTKKGKKRT